jgi:hypothetical protein
VEADKVVRRRGSHVFYTTDSQMAFDRLDYILSKPDFSLNLSYSIDFSKSNEVPNGKIQMLTNRFHTESQKNPATQYSCPRGT